MQKANHLAKTSQYWDVCGRSYQLSPVPRSICEETDIQTHRHTHTLESYGEKRGGREDRAGQGGTVAERAWYRSKKHVHSHNNSMCVRGGSV